MTDLWSFLLQTLTVSGVAVLVLLLKSMFRDKLSPRWQWGAWAVLALPLLMPAGFLGRYVLVNWPLFVETLKSVATGRFDTLTRVYAPVPLPPRALPGSLWDWLYILYLLGALALLVHYIFTYIRLRRALRQGAPVSPEVQEQIDSVAARYGLKTCAAVEVPGLGTAFVCGVFRPVLALPQGGMVDDKVILHELLHLKHHDAAWGLVLCLFRCIHWCNPLLFFCANQAGNDLESLCDQRVLERLEGEERREYGRILLDMADERYARTPGTSSMANGGKNIRQRIEAIARFKRYPAGMALASVCVTLLIAVPVAFGSSAGEVWNVEFQGEQPWFLARSMASARTVPCTTPAGAVDAYGKAVLTGRAVYRAMCAPLEEQAELAETIRAHPGGRPWEQWSVTPVYALAQEGWRLYNFSGSEEEGYEGLLAVQMATGPEDAPPPPKDNTFYCYLALQTIRVEEREGRWVVEPLEPFRTELVQGYDSLRNLGNNYQPNDHISCRLYEAQAGDFTIQLRWQTVLMVDSYTQDNSGFFSYTTYDTTPDPDAAFTIYRGRELRALYTGDEAGKGRYHSIGAACAWLRPDGSRPELFSLNPSLQKPGATEASGSSSDGSSWGVMSLAGDWDNDIFLTGGGGTGTEADITRSQGFAVNLYLNGELMAELTLLPVEGGGDFD